MSRVKNTEALVADMSSKEVIQDIFKKWSGKPPFPKRKREVNVVKEINKRGTSSYNFLGKSQNRSFG